MPGLETITPQVPAPNAPAPDPSRPAWLPEKFKTPEDMAAAYSELEKKQGSQQPPAPALDVSNVDAARTTLKDKGLDFKKYEAEYLKDGKLADASMKELTAIGLTEQQVSVFIKSQEDHAAGETKKIYDTVGGKDRFDKLMEFAKTGGLSKSEADAFNGAVQSGNYDAVKLMVQGLNTAYEATLGKEPNLASGNGSNVPSDIFGSKTEMHSAMSDPRYLKDTNYRNSVLEKIKRSTNLWKAS